MVRRLVASILALMLPKQPLGVPLFLPLTLAVQLHGAPICDCGTMIILKCMMATISILSPIPMLVLQLGARPVAGYLLPYFPCALSFGFRWFVARVSQAEIVLALLLPRNWTGRCLIP